MSAQGESSYATYNQNATINSVGTAEYLIDGASSYEAIWAQPKPASGDLHLISYEKREGVAYVSVENDGGEAAISLPIYNYGNYYAADESGAPFAITSGENMRIVLTIPAATPARSMSGTTPPSIGARLRRSLPSACWGSSAAALLPAASAAPCHCVNEVTTHAQPHQLSA